jgi:hypothetical protein
MHCFVEMSAVLSESNSDALLIRDVKTSVDLCGGRFGWDGGETRIENRNDRIQ